MGRGTFIFVFANIWNALPTELQKIETLYKSTWNHTPVVSKPHLCQFHLPALLLRVMYFLVVHVVVTRCLRIILMGGYPVQL